MPTISRRLASAGRADPGDLKSPSLPGASPGSPTGVWLTGNSRPVRLKTEQPWECKSPHADQFGMSTGRASRTCLLNSGLPEKGGASPRHSAMPLQAATNALVAQRDSFCSPFLSLWCSPDNMPASHAGDHRSEAGQGRQFMPLKHF